MKNNDGQYFYVLSFINKNIEDEGIFYKFLIYNYYKMMDIGACMYVIINMPIP